jgi:hypothetical protein
VKRGAYLASKENRACGRPDTREKQRRASVDGALRKNPEGKHPTAARTNLFVRR